MAKNLSKEIKVGGTIFLYAVNSIDLEIKKKNVKVTAIDGECIEVYEPDVSEHEESQYWIPFLWLELDDALVTCSKKIWIANYFTIVNNDVLAATKIKNAIQDASKKKFHDSNVLQSMVTSINKEYGFSHELNATSKTVDINGVSFHDEMLAELRVQRDEFEILYNEVEDTDEHAEEKREEYQRGKAALDYAINSIMELRKLNTKAPTNDNKVKLYILTTTYSFDLTVETRIYDSLDSAKAKLAADFEEEIRIDTEENGHVFGEDYSIVQDEDGMSASIHIGQDGAEIDSTYWHIQEVEIDNSVFLPEKMYASTVMCTDNNLVHAKLFTSEAAALEHCHGAMKRAINNGIENGNMIGCADVGDPYCSYKGEVMWRNGRKSVFSVREFKVS